ncbi:hypothetical protein ABVT39_012439 [Epinephelus coioides]
MADFGEILRNIGEFGLFQKLTLITLGYTNFFQAFVLGALLFVEPDPERHCNTDWILQADSNLTTEEQLNLTLPRMEDGTFSRCFMFVPVDWDIGAIREYGLNETTRCQNGWVYHNTMYEATIVTDFDLVCNKANILQIAQTVLMAGILVGSIMSGPVAESFGRKRAVQIGGLIFCIFNIITPLCPNIHFYLACLFLSGFGSGGYRVSAIVLSTEWIGPSKRSWGTCVTALFGAVGQCVLPGVVYVVRDWRLSQLILLAPLGVIVFYIWFIPESARWLLSRGRTEEAKREIVKAASINKRPIPDSLLQKIAVNNAVQKDGIKVIFRSCLLTGRFFCVLVAWFSLNLGLYSLHLNMGTFGLSIFLTQLLFGVTEIPAYLLVVWLLEVFGRKKLIISTLIAGALSAAVILAVPQEYAIVVTTLVVSARFFLVWSGAICSVFMQELFPTSVRQTVTALGNMSARGGGTMAPLLNMLAVFHWVLPTAIFSSLILASAALCFLLPETSRKELPESAADSKNNRDVTATTTAGHKQTETRL